MSIIKSGTIFIAFDDLIAARILVDAVYMNILRAISKTGSSDILNLVRGQFRVESVCPSSHTIEKHVTHGHHYAELVRIVDLVQTTRREFIKNSGHGRTHQSQSIVEF